MKRKFLSLSFIVTVLVLNAQVPTAGLVGAWPFNGNANDISGNGNNGTVFGATLTTDRCGNANSAYYFDGINDYMKMLTTGPTGTVSRSISFWSKSSYLGTSPRVGFCYGASTGNFDAFQIVYNYNCVGVGIDNSQSALIRSNNCLMNNNWHHVVAIYNSSVSPALGGVTFYVDCVLQPNITCVVGSSTSIINTGLPNAVTIGCQSNGPGRFFPGSLDDFYLYNRVLTYSEVQQLYGICLPVIAGPTVVCQGSVFVYSVTPIPGTTTYSWTMPNGWTGTSSSNTISVTAGLSPGLIMVTGTGTCGVINSAVLSVTVEPVSAVTVVSTSSVLCAGTPATLSASGVGSCSWQPGNQSGTVISISPTVTTVYSLTGVNGASCPVSGTFTQVVVALPNVTAGATKTIICKNFNQTAILTGTGAVNYNWQPGNLSGTSVTVAPAANTIVVYTVTGTNANGCSKTGTIAVKSMICEGVDERGFGVACRIFPNPSGGLFSVEVADAILYEILTATGEKIGQGNFSPGLSHIDLQGRAAGIYFIKIRSAGKDTIVKLIKE